MLSELNVIVLATFSPGFNWSRLTIAVPFDVLFPSGTSYAFNLYTLPLFVKNRIVEYVVVDISSLTKSSSLVVRADIPLPPLF